MRNRAFPMLCLVSYTFILFKILVLKDLPMVRIGGLMFNFGGTQSGQPNFIPFKTIIPYLQGRSGLLIAALNIIGNIALLIPIGFLIPFVYKKMNAIKSLMFAVIFCLFIEVLQAYLKIGIFDIDDVILNGFGVMIGYWVYTLLPKFILAFKSYKVLFYTLIGLILIAVIYVVSFLFDHRAPIQFESTVQHRHEKGANKNDNKSDLQEDLCRGTGGTGRNIDIQNKKFTIQRKDGVKEFIHITDETKIMTSSGEANETILKIGMKVTLIIQSEDVNNKVASLILVCK